jgi:hypothetical protein
MNQIPFPQGRTFELWVFDSGELDTFGVFLNGQLVKRVRDTKKTHKFTIARPVSHCAVVVHFGGNDSGVSAIFDVTDGREVGLEQQTPKDGFRHSYILESV